ncbi:hypothetical protein ACFLS0_06450 [Candidatus Bipolaricaulota bacterium]
MAKRSFFIMVVVLWIASTAGHATLAIIGTMSWDGMYGPPMNLVYDDNGRRSLTGSILGGLIWLDRFYSDGEIQVDASLGMGENARLFANLMNQSDWIITLEPGYTIDSWDSVWRLPHSGTNPTSNPLDSELLHLVADELGNERGSPFYECGLFGRVLVETPGGKGSGFFGYWLDQDVESVQGTEIWYNTRSGGQEIVPAGFHGGFALFVRSATVSYDPYSSEPGDVPRRVAALEGFMVSSGSSEDLDAFHKPYDYSQPDGSALASIVGMGITGSDDHVYAWYSDGTVSSGISSDLDYYRVRYSFSLPPGKVPTDIVGMGIAGSDDRVYAWYNDGTVSIGISSDLDYHQAPYAYSLPPDKIPTNIVGMGIAGSDDHVFAWYRDGTVSSGTSSDLDLYRAPYPYSLPEGKYPSDVVGMGIAGSNDFVYVWYRLCIR